MPEKKLRALFDHHGRRNLFYHFQAGIRQDRRERRAGDLQSKAPAKSLNDALNHIADVGRMVTIFCEIGGAFVIITIIGWIEFWVLWAYWCYLEKKKMHLYEIWMEMHQE